MNAKVTYYLQLAIVLLTSILWQTVGMRQLLALRCVFTNHKIEYKYEN